MKPLDRKPLPDVAARARAVDPESLPESVRRALQVYLDEGGVDPARGATFLDSCARWVEVVARDRWRLPPSEQRQQLLALADAAREVQRAVNGLDDGLVKLLEGVARQAARRGNGLGIELSSAARGALAQRARGESVLVPVWDVAHALESLARAAAGGIEVHARRRVHEEAGAGLARLVVGAYVVQFGALPPAGNGQWFVAFMEALGTHVGVRCGFKIVAKAVREARNSASGEQAAE